MLLIIKDYENLKSSRCHDVTENTATYTTDATMYLKINRITWK